MSKKTKPAILAVDDDPAVLRAVSQDLRRRYGDTYRVLRAPSGTEALEALKTLKERDEPVALIVSDQRMPQMDGVAMLGESMELYPDTKRALLTAYADTDAAISAINESKVDYYLMKPWDPPEQRLYPIIDDLLADWQLLYRPGFGGIRVIGDRWSAASHEVKDFLARNQIPYTFTDIEKSAEARALATELASGDGAPSLPIVVLPDGEQLVSPSATVVAEKLGLRVQADQAFYDLAIVGGGPAGLAAAVYGASEGLRTVLIEESATGGQAGTSSRIENYLGFPVGLSGADLARRATAQAQRFGVEILTPQSVSGLAVDGPYKQLTLKDGSTLNCHALMLTMGVSWRKLPADGADTLTSRGIYYGAAMTEALNCRNEEVYIIGAGNSAGQAAMFFCEYARKVTMLVRGESLASKMSHYLVSRIEERENIEVLTHTSVTHCKGKDRLEQLVLTNSQTNTTNEVPANFLFVFIGAVPRTDWLGDIVASDARGFVITGSELDKETQLQNWPLERDPYLLETNVPGIFAAGDIRSGSVKRVASAVGEGSVSVHFIHRFLASL
ncbi:MAG: FAD-dependent oxidoreductase [Bacteroidota bacterium]